MNIETSDCLFTDALYKKKVCRNILVYYTRNIAFYVFKKKENVIYNFYVKENPRMVYKIY